LATTDVYARYKEVGNWMAGKESFRHPDSKIIHKILRVMDQSVTLWDRFPRVSAEFYSGRWLVQKISIFPH
jgi:hypothetical protein